MVEIVVKMTALDYNYMCSNGSYWSDSVGDRSDMELLARYQSETNPGQVPGRHWNREDTIGSDRTKLMLARSFLDAMDIPYEVVYDTYTWENGEEMGWLILSDYDNHNDPVVEEDRRVWLRQRAVVAGDDQAQQYYAPSAAEESGEGPK